MGSQEHRYATEGNLAGVLHEARFAGGIAASGQRAGFGGNLFTRDSLRMMRDTMDHYPSMTRELLGILPQMQGVELNEATNEFPDAMPHQTFREISGGRRLPGKQVEDVEFWTSKWGVPLESNREEGKHFTIYNSSDGPLLYLITLAEFMKQPEGAGVMNDEFLHKPTLTTRTVDEAARRCVSAIMRSIEASEEKGSGLYVVPNTNPKQTSPSGVMRDGFDSYYYPEGEIGKPVDFGFLAYIDNQALAYEALTKSAKELFPDDDDAPKWLETAEEIRRRTLEAAWLEESGIFAAAVDINNKPVALESNAAAELLNGPFLQFNDGPDYVRKVIEWMYSDDVMTPIGPRMISKKFSNFEGDYYAYQGSGAVWPHANGIIAKGLRNSWGLHTLSHDLGVDRTLGLFDRAGEAVELAYVHRETNQPVYNPYPSKLQRRLGGISIAPAEIGQLDQGWAASAGLRELWDWRGGVPEERPGTWQRSFTRHILDLVKSTPPASAGLPAQDIYVDLEHGKQLKQERAEQMNLAG